MLEKSTCGNGGIGMYKAKNVDTDKALDAIDEARRAQEQIITLEIEKLRAKMEGVYLGLSIAESIFTCSNYEKKEPKLEEMG